MKSEEGWTSGRSYETEYEQQVKSNRRQKHELSADRMSQGIQPLKDIYRRVTA